MNKKHCLYVFYRFSDWMTLVISVILGIEDGAFMGGPTAFKIFKIAVIPQEASSFS